jgi:outer membrane protein assembly factor BamA
VKSLQRHFLVLITVLLFLMQAGIQNHVYSQVVTADTLTLRSSVIRQIVITGNHKTVRRIITREIIFHEGDTLPAYILESSIERSRENLMNTGLFNFVDIQYFRGQNDDVVVHVDVTERWYLWPLPIFEIADRNFNEWFRKRDLSRINAGMYLTQDNFRGMDETVKIQFLLGYTQRLGLYYQVPYINRKQNIGLQGGISVSRNREVVYMVKDNKLNFYNDPEQFVRKDFQAYLRMTKRKGVYHYYAITGEYRRTSVLDTVIKLNSEFFTNTTPVQQHIGIGWSYRYDRRDYQPYPMKGYVFEVEGFKAGLNLLPNEPSLTGFSTTVRGYKPLSKRWNIAAGLRGRLMQRIRGPFFNQRALGYGSDYIRTYDYYVINGQNFALFKSNLKYTLMPVRIYHLPVLRSDKFKKIPMSFHLNGFFDAGYARDRFYAEGNPLSNKLQYSYGIGIDYVTYYDLVFRLEYGNNRISEPGLFFHIGASF